MQIKILFGGIIDYTYICLCNKTITIMEEILELESEMKKTSVPYRDSTAFSLALDYIKRTDYNYYCKLIEIESRECGIID